MATHDGFKIAYSREEKIEKYTLNCMVAFISSGKYSYITHPEMIDKSITIASDLLDAMDKFNRENEEDGVGITYIDHDDEEEKGIF